MTKTISLLSSIRFYQKLIETKNQLEKLGFQTIVPPLSLMMEKENNYDPKFFLKTYYQGSVADNKADIVMDNFKRLSAADLVLVINQTKNNIEGYIGGNVLMEIGLAFYLDKKVYLLNPTSEKLSYFDEITALCEPSIAGDLGRIK